VGACLAMLVLPLASGLILPAIPAAAATSLTVGTNTSTFREPVAPHALHVVGEVSNAPNSDSARFVRVTCTLYDASNTVLTFETTGTAADILLGGETSPFDALFLSPPASVDHYTCVLASGPATTTVANHHFTTTVTNVAPGSEGLQHVTGTVTNNNDVASEDLTVILTYYDSAHLVIDEGTVAIDGPVAAGATVTFHAVANNPAWDGINSAAMTEALTPAVSLTPSVTFADQIRGTTSGPMTATVSNVGTGDLHLPANAVSLAGSDPGSFAITADTCSGKVVAPDASCTVSVTFTPMGVRSLSALLQVADDVSGSPQSVLLSGNGLSRAAISAAPSPLVFGSQLVNSSSNQVITLSSSGLSDAPASITAIGLDSTTDFTANTSACAPSGFPTALMAAGTSCAITITFTPSDVGTRTATLTITAVDGDGHAARFSPIQIQVTGNGTLASSHVDKSQLAFGSIAVNTTSDSQAVRLTSTGTGPLIVSKIETTGDFTETNNCGPFPASLATDQFCTINVTFAPLSPGPKAGSLRITDNAAGGTPPVGLSGTGVAATTFYFAEGFTGTGFTESLFILTPSQSGTATIDYYTEQGHQPTIVQAVTAGHVFVEDVNHDVGAGHQVSARVILTVPGVVERGIHFNNGSWHGSTDKVGASQAATEWDFAEGSTLSIFAEFLSIQNPNPSPVVVDLTYGTDIGKHPVKTLTVAANTRITIVVGLGDTNDNPNCDALTTCGVGGGVTGVSVQLKSRTLPIVAERPFYVNNYSFGYGPIRDGHDAFGANGAATTWNFAEGTTLGGFNEYLTLQNPGLTAATVTLKYLYDLGTKIVTVNVPAQSRVTALVFDAAHLGVGRGYVGVSTVITSTQPIVAERPMYIYFNFGSGPVAGADVVVGATGLGTLFGFAAASTAAGDNDYLTIQNSGSIDANLTVDYYTASGKVSKTFKVLANSRHTVLVFSDNGEGVGPGFSPLGIVISSDQPVLVEKPTYSANTATFGATDTTGYTPPGGF
jgi:hypothetical protein